MSSSTKVVSVNNVSKRFIIRRDRSLKERMLSFRRPAIDDFWALRDVSLDVDLGSTVGLVGHNGSGKSTLLKAIGGIIPPSSGTVRRRGRLAALLELGAGFHPDLSGRQNVYLNAAILGLSKVETAKVFDAIVDFSGIEEFIDTQVKYYSSGMYVRLAFAVAVHVDPDILLVDEVLAVGDEVFQRKCLERIEQFQAEGRSIVLVSHSADQIGRFCDRVVVLQSGRVVHDGDTAEGLRVLREGYSRLERAEVDDDWDPAQPYRLLAATTTLRRIGGGLSDLDLDMDIRINTPVNDWGFGIDIQNTVGMQCYSVTSFAIGTPLPNERGDHRIRLTLPELRLGAGSYLVSIGLGDGSGRNFDRRESIATFDIPTSGIGQGIISVTPTVTPLGPLNA